MDSLRLDFSYASAEIYAVLKSTGQAGNALPNVPFFECSVPENEPGSPFRGRPVFTRLVLITAHAKSINAIRHMMANRPVSLGLWRGAFSYVWYVCMRFELLSFHTAWVNRDQAEPAAIPAMSAMPRSRPNIGVAEKFR
jgi:hypothetical protein